MWRTYANKIKFTTPKHQLSQHRHYGLGLAVTCINWFSDERLVFVVLLPIDGKIPGHLFLTVDPKPCFCKQTHMLTLYPNVIWHSLRKINLINAKVVSPWWLLSSKHVADAFSLWDSKCLKSGFLSEYCECVSWESEKKISPYFFGVTFNFLECHRK